jgi:hypothetical protein
MLAGPVMRGRSPAPQAVPPPTRFPSLFRAWPYTYALASCRLSPRARLAHPSLPSPHRVRGGPLGDDGLWTPAPWPLQAQASFLGRGPTGFVGSGASRCEVSAMSFWLGGLGGVYRMWHFGIGFRRWRFGGLVRSQLGLGRWLGPGLGRIPAWVFWVHFGLALWRALGL